jgi:hypothetical protein
MTLNKPVIAYIVLILGFSAQCANSAVEYRYESNFFDLFSCSGNSLCSVQDPAFTSYTGADFVRVSLTLAEPLGSNLILQDVTGFPGFGLTLHDGQQELSFVNEVLISTDGDGNIIEPWSIIGFCCSFPNNGIASVNWPGVRGVIDEGVLSAPTGDFPDTPLNQASVSVPGTWSLASLEPVVLTAPCVDDPSLTCATGIEGLTISGLTYDVDFVLDSYNATYSAGPPLFMGGGPGDPAFEAANALASALSTVDGIFGVIGKGSVRSQIQVPWADFGGDTASAMFLVCSSLNESGCAGWLNSFASVISKSTVTDGPDIYGPYARFQLSDPSGQNQPPVADAGSDQAVRAGDIVFLDGGASFDDNTATASLDYAWSFVSLPTGSTATLTAVNTGTPSFVVDVAGTYAIQLIVTDEGGLPSPPDEVIISSDNLAPTANAGPDELVIVGSTVLLDGNGSTDPEGDPMTHSWAMSSAPVSSTARLIDANTTLPSFAPDLEGAFEVTLVVSDFIGPGAPDSVNITAVSSDQFAVIKIVAAGETIAALTPEDVTTQGNQNALMNFLTQAIVAIQVGDLAEAIDKLEKSLSRTDGCVLRGSPDGNGSGRDWITDCTAQMMIYDSLHLALTTLTP